MRSARAHTVANHGTDATLGPGLSLRNFANVKSEIKRHLAMLSATVMVLVGLVGCTADDTSSPASTVSTPTTANQARPNACWPSATEGFDSAIEAAQTFVARVLGVNPRVGDFRATGTSTGAIDVYIGEDLNSGPEIVRGTLHLAQIRGLGWFVIDASNEYNTIDAPVADAVVSANGLVVSGSARGFEGQVAIELYAPESVRGTTSVTPVARTSAIAGSAEEPKAFSVTVDLPGVDVGDTICIVVRGGRGLEQDPGEFTMIPVVIGERD